MRRSRFVFTMLALVSLGAVAAARPRADDRETGAREVHRIRAHFDSVLTELDTSPAARSLDARQRDSRFALRATLARYRDRGTFPRNIDFPGQAVPYFVDRERGTLCAVAHLLESTGRRDIVDRVARANNNVWVTELGGDTAFTEWLGRNGITLAEAARIQVPYVIGPPAMDPTTRSLLQGAALAGSVGSLSLTALNLRWNADGHRRSANLLGVVSGLTTAGLGVASLGERDAPREVGAGAIVVGGLSVALATRGIVRHRVAERAREAERTRLAASVAPFHSANGGGMSVSLRF